MKTNIVGLIYTGERNDHLGELTRVRSVAALPVLGRYRLIDFMMSSMVNSGIHNIGIILQRSYQSLLDHIGSGREWNLHGKRAGLTLLPPFVTRDNNSYYEGLLDALKSNITFLRRSKEKYIAVTDSYILYSLPFDDVLEKHLDNKADITLLYSKDRDMRRSGSGRYIEVDEDGVVKRIESNPNIPHYPNSYIGVFLIRRELLIDLVDRAASRGQHHFTRELLVDILNNDSYKVCGYECPGKVWCIDSVDAFYKANMDALNPDIRKDLFNNDRPVWTKLRDEMPARYAPKSKVSNSLVADGCVVEGTVENSILFRGVIVRADAVVKNCILMQDSLISRNVQVENCILDKQATIREDGRLISSPGFPIVVGKSLTIG